MSIGKRSDMLQHVWLAMRQIQRSNRDHNKLERRVLRHWAYCLDQLKGATKIVWQDCTSWEGEILGLSRQHVCGLLPYHPGFDEPVWPETEAIKEGLVSLHDFGLLTQYSEPGNFEVDEDQETCTRTRPHLFFTMPTTNTRLDETSIRKFLHNLERSDAIWYHITYHYPSASVPAASSRAFPKYSDRLSMNFPGQERRKFVCEQSGQFTNTMCEWEDSSFQYFPGPAYRERQGTGGLNDFDAPFQACLAVDPLQICIVSREFTTSDNKKQDLQDLVIELLIQAGLQRLPQPESHSPESGYAVIVDGTQNDEQDRKASHALKNLEILVEQAEQQELVRGFVLDNNEESEVDDQDTRSTNYCISSINEDMDGDSDGTKVDETEDLDDGEEIKGRLRMNEVEIEVVAEDVNGHGARMAPNNRQRTVGNDGNGSITRKNAPET